MVYDITMKVIQKIAEIDFCWGDTDVYSVSNLEMIAIIMNLAILILSRPKV